MELYVLLCWYYKSICYYKIFESVNEKRKTEENSENLLNKLHRSLESIRFVDYESQKEQANDNHRRIQM